MKIALRIGVIALAAILAACAQPSSQNTKKLTAGQARRLVDQVCHSPPEFQCTQQPFTVNLTMRDGSVYKRTFDPPIPIIQRGVVTVFAGQTVNVEAVANKNGKLVKLHLVSEVTHPQHTMTFKLSQTSSGGGPSMMLIVHNPFDRLLEYKADIQPLADRNFHHTSICPVYSGIDGIVYWPDPIFQVRLSGFRLASGKTGVVCK